MSSRKWIEDAEKSIRATKLPQGILNESPITIAAAIKRTVMETPDVGHQSKYETATAMIDHFIKHAVEGGTPEDKARLEQAKVELRKLFGKNGS